MVAIILRVLVAVLGFVAANGWWQIPAFVGLWKVQEAVTSPVPQDPRQQSPIQQATAAAGGASRGIGELFSENMPLVLVGGAALFILTRR